MKFRCGLEVHVRVGKRRKLFCHCPPRLSDREPSLRVTRRLRAVSGESGLKDRAALFEEKTGREFVYLFYPDSCCLVELDEEPIHEIDPESLECAVKVARLLHCDIPDRLYVMRKIVVDGSNTSGFQRTVLVGLNGWIEVDRKRVGIKSVCLEEESAGIVEKSKKRTVFRLDRLGIPLVEISTEPVITDAEFAMKVAEKLCMIVRSTGLAHRGLGSVRQDLNVSVEGGARVEIKGVQELEMIPKIIEAEVERQARLISSGKKPEPETRVALPDGSSEFMRPLPGSERMYPETDIGPLDVPEVELPETLEERLERLKRRIPEQLARQVLKSEYLDLVEKLSEKHDPVFVAHFFTSVLKDFRRRGLEVREEDIISAFSLAERGRIEEKAIPDLLEEVSSGKSFEEVVPKYSPLDRSELERIILEVAAENPDLVERKNLKALMGEVMKKVKGRAPGSEVFALVKEVVSRRTSSASS